MGNLYKYDHNWNLISQITVTGTVYLGIDWIGDGEKYLISQTSSGRKQITQSEINWGAATVKVLTVIQGSTSLLVFYNGCAFSNVGFSAIEDAPRPFDYCYFAQEQTSIPATFSLFKEDMKGNRIKTIINSSTAIHVFGVDVNDRNGDVYITDNIASGPYLKVYDTNNQLKRSVVLPMAVPGDIYFDGTHIYVPDQGAGAKIYQIDAVTGAVVGQSPTLVAAMACVTGNGQYFITGN